VAWEKRIGQAIEFIDGLPDTLFRSFH